MTTAVQSPPKDDLVRARFMGDLELREGAEGSTPTMAGHFAVFDRWTEIDSMWEGRFLERIAPGAFAKTISEQRAGMRVLFQHGRDPQVGDKPIGTIDTLREDDIGAFYEVSLLRSVPDLLLDGMRAGLYGASFRFKVVREEFSEDPGTSAHNPSGMPERTIKEAQVREFGPVTFPAYAAATAGVRSLTDDFVLARMIGQDPDRLAAVLDALRTHQDGGISAATEPSDPDGAADTGTPPEVETIDERTAPGTTPTPRPIVIRTERPSWDLGRFTAPAPGTTPTPNADTIQRQRKETPTWRLPSTS